MQGDGQPELQRLVGQLADLRREAAGGNRDLARADAAAPGRVEDVQRLEQVVVIRQRLAHAHDDEVADEALGWVGTPSREAVRVLAGADASAQASLTCALALAFPALDRQHLVDDFLHAQIAFPAVEAARAEFAAVGAADLRGDAERMAVAGVAVERRVGRDEHAFDERVVAQPPEEFLRGVARALFADQFEGGQGVMRAQLLAQGAWAGWSSRPRPWRDGRRAIRAVALTR